MRFEFTAPARIVFGSGSIKEVVPAASHFGRHALVVTGRDQHRVAPLIRQLEAASIQVTTATIAAEPTTDDIVNATARAREDGCEFVIGFGGGSAIDAAKAVSALLTNPGDLFDYLEVVGRAQPLAHAAAPCIAVPTTAGTGAEVTRNAVLASLRHRVKVSLRSPLMLPRLAIVDPDLTLDLPPAITASTGLDALTQLIEPYVSSRANPLTDSLCAEALRRAGPALKRAYQDGRDLAARTDMAYASLCGGLALANAGLGAVHGFAGPIGGAFDAPHGAICAALLPHVMDANLHAVAERAPASDTIRRYTDVARFLTGRDNATADDGVQWVRQLVVELGIPRLSAYGLTKEAIPSLVQAAARASSMKANPLPLTADELGAILFAAL
jgi:alcohol dehydrogenase class IV